MGAELTAAIEGLAYLVASGVREVELLSDSRYLVRGMSSNGRTGWAHAAVEREWRTTRGKPLANRDFWERLLELEGCLAGGRHGGSVRRGHYPLMRLLGVGDHRAVSARDLDRVGAHPLCELPLASGGITSSFSATR
jgi:RNase H